jgi:branched-chain amino acid transport system permease protein
MESSLIYFLQLVVSGLSVGSIYAIIGIGYVIIYKSTKILNFAHGEIMMIGAYLCMVLISRFHFSFTAAFIVTLLFSALMGIVLERLIFRPMIGQPVFAAVMITLGLSILLRTSTGMVFGYGNEIFPSPFSEEPIVISEIVISHAHIWTILVSCGVVCMLVMFFRYSSIGISMRAAAENQINAFIIGINVKRMFSLTWLIAAVTGSLAGVLLSNVLVMNTNLSMVAIKAFPAIILGGLDSLGGALLGGLIIGVVENLVGGYLEVYLGGIKEISVYILLFVILIIKPYGFFGTEEIEKV